MPAACGVSTSALAIVAAAGPQIPVPLTANDEAELLRLQGRVRGVDAREGRAVRGRALLLRGQYRFARKHGAVSLTAYAKSVGFDYEAASLTYHTTAQLLLNKNVSAALEGERESLQNEAAQLARAIAALEQRDSEHDALDDDQFVAWYEKMGRISGIARDYLETKRNQKAQARGDKTAVVPAKTPDEQVDDLFANVSALEIAAVSGIPTGQEGLFIYRQEGDTMRLIPLTAPKTAIIGLAGYAPGPLAEAPKDLVFYRQMLMAAAAFVPDQISDIPVEDVPEGDVANASYNMLPANAIYLVERGRFSIAHARKEDGLIVEVVPHVDLGFSMAGDQFIDNLTRRRLDNALAGEADAAQFAAAAVDGAAARLAITGRTKTLTFTRADTGAKINLIVKQRNMRSVWIYRVSGSFTPVAEAAMTPTTVGEFDRSFVKALLKKQPERTITISVGSKGINFANGSAAAISFDADVTGKDRVQVTLTDLRRAMVGFMGLPLIGGLTWRLDPDGMLLVEAATDVATYRVYLQTLEPKREQPTRSRTLRERVESLPQQDAPAAQAA